MKYYIKTLNEYKKDIDYSKIFKYKIKNNEVIITKYKGKETVVTVPDEIEGVTVTVIGEYAFYNCKNLKEITLSNSITEIDKSAFKSCINLTKINFPFSLTIIREHAFFFCKNLKEMNIPNSLTNIGYSAFYKCKNLNKDIKDILINKWKCVI